MTDRLLTAAELADVLGVSRGFVYEHADRLGAIRFGDGPRAPIRFDPEIARRGFGRQQEPRTAAPPPPGRRPRARRSTAGSILRVRPRTE